MRPAKAIIFANFIFKFDSLMLFCERRLNGEAGAVQAAFKNVKLAAESRSSIEIYVKILVCQSILNDPNTGHEKTTIFQFVCLGFLIGHQITTLFIHSLIVIFLLIRHPAFCAL